MKHRKPLLIIATVIVLAGVTAAAFGIGSSKRPHNNDPSATHEFVMVGTSGLSFRATILATYNGDAPDRKTIFDRGITGASRLTTTSDGRLAATVYSGETTYSCDSQSCHKIAKDDNTEQLAYDFLPGTIERLRRQAVYKGETACPAGSCFVWSIAPDSTMLSSYSETLYVDKRTKSISKDVRKYTTTGYTTTVTYDYQPQDITLPPVPQEVPKL